MEREMQQCNDDTDEKFGKLLDEYKRGSESIIALKDKYQNMSSLLIVEEDQIKNKNLEISELQNELHELKTKAEDKEERVKSTTQEVNEFIFQLEKYSASQNPELTATIDRYKMEKVNYELNDKRDIKTKNLLSGNLPQAIWEVANEFSVVTESNYDRNASSCVTGIDDINFGANNSNSRPTSQVMGNLRNTEPIGEQSREEDQSFCLSDRD